MSIEHILLMLYMLTAQINQNVDHHINYDFMCIDTKWTTSRHQPVGRPHKINQYVRYRSPSVCDVLFISSVCVRSIYLLVYILWCTHSRRATTFRLIGDRCDR